ncbi:MAG TPA: trehalose-phosphatase [Thermoleophilaceae bacterium]|nr:trehalose-phosphatase [Thermoleophilaceae bacterium]
MSDPTAETLAESLLPLTAEPSRAAVFCDIDGTLAPIVNRPEDSRVPEEASVVLSKLGRTYGCVACVSGRPAAEARRLVGVGGVAYVGSHGAELLEPGSSTPQFLDAFVRWEGRVREFVEAQQEDRDLKLLRIRIEDKGPIKAFHWRDVPDEAAAEQWLQNVAQEAQEAELEIHWGRKVLEIRPPVPVDKGQGVTRMLQSSGVRSALYGGDDVTDLDAFDALQSLVASGDLDAAVCVGVRSTEGPRAIVDRADLVVDGVSGFRDVLLALVK